MSDREHGNLSYKLRMRAGALSQLAAHPVKDPGEVARDVRDIYNERSAIVHGSGGVSGTVSFAGRHSSLKLAIDYLRSIIWLIVTNSRFADPTNIDKELLLGLASDEES
ncbi:MAG: hypothetical protein R2849_22795 [Thermomicrobiales bacterium]